MYKLEFIWPLSSHCACSSLSSGNPQTHTIDIALFSRKIIEIPITDEEAYEKNVIMYVVIGDPRHIAGNDYLSVLYFSYSAPNLNSDYFW